MRTVYSSRGQSVIAVLLLLVISFVICAVAADTVVYEGKSGPGKSKHIVFLSGDEEYRSEEGLPQLAKILAGRHGFKCTVLFAIDPADGTINPNKRDSLPGSEAIDSADVIVMLLRFRDWPDADMKHFVDAYLAGKPIIALRTSTHAFNYDDNPKSEYKKFSWTTKEWRGGFGKQVLGETWVNHWGRHKQESTRGVIEPSANDSPLLRGVTDLFADSDVYEAYPPPDATILVRGQVLKGMQSSDPPAEYKKKRATDKEEQGINEPMMAVAWTRLYRNEAGKTNKIFCTTLGAATDLKNESLRRLVVNAVYWGIGLDVPAKANVDLVGDYNPTMYGFDGFKRGIKPSSLGGAQNSSSAR